MCATIPFATIEMAGRRRLFMLSGAGMALCMVGQLDQHRTVSLSPTDVCSSALPSAHHKCPAPSTQATQALFLCSFSSRSTPSATSASTSSSARRSSPRGTVRLLQVCRPQCTGLHLTSCHVSAVPSCLKRRSQLPHLPVNPAYLLASVSATLLTEPAARCLCSHSPQ
jgi:hypothetical protein